MCNQCDMCSWRAFTNLFSEAAAATTFTGDIIPVRAIKQKLLLDIKDDDVSFIRWQVFSFFWRKLGDVIWPQVEELRSTSCFGLDSFFFRVLRYFFFFFLCM